MTDPADLPPGEPFHNYDVFQAFHAYVKMKDLNAGVKFASRLALDRARQAGHNPRNGTITVYFDDDGVGAKWEPK